jgi:nucleoside-diphosphate-sugar epimerase
MFYLITLSCKVIFHCAADVDFNARLDHALRLNCMGTLKVLDLAQGTHQLSFWLAMCMSPAPAT